MNVNLLIINGQCLSMEENLIYNWIAISGEKIVLTGFKDEYKKYDIIYDTLIDAKGASVLPGFIDGHFRLVQTAINKCNVDLSQTRSFSDIGDLIQEAGRKNKEDSIHGIRLDINQIKEKRIPNRMEIDKFWNDSAVWINSNDYLVSALNTYGILYYKIPFSQVGVECDLKNVPTGVFRQQANALLRRNILQRSSDIERINALHRLEPELAALGLTTVCAMEGGKMHSDRDAEFVYDVIHNKDVYFDIELFYQTLNVERIIGMGLSRLGGCLYVDGTFNTRTAAISFDYFDSPGNRGALYFSQEKMNELVEQCYFRNLQLALYTIGDRAIEMALLAHEHALRLTGNYSLRHRLEHAELVTEEQINKAKEMEIIFSMQPTYELNWGKPGGMYERRLGSAYKKTNPFRSILDHGAIICGGSDSDTSPANYIASIYAAVNHPIEKHRVSVFEAIQMFTSSGAYAIGKEKEKGYIKNGYFADIVILDKDILSINEKEINSLKVRTTIKAGKIVYENGLFIR